jgi:hypothetical protein
MAVSFISRPLAHCALPRATSFWVAGAGGMIGVLWFVVAVLASPFKSKIRLEAENATLRHPLLVCVPKTLSG